MRKVVTDTLEWGRENGACSGPIGMTNKKTALVRDVTILFMERRFSNSRKDCHAQQDGNSPELIKTGSKHE
jgi:hypothetical protein